MSKSTIFAIPDFIGGIKSTLQTWQLHHKASMEFGFYPNFTDISKKVDNDLGGMSCKEENTRKSLSEKPLL